MAQAKAKAKEEKPKYAMPAVEVGDSVLWHDDVESPPTGMALVTAVGTESVTLAVLGEGYQNFLVKTGVRHQHHPGKELIRQTDSGVWTHRPGLLAILERLAQVESLLNDLTTPVQDPPGPR